MTQNQSNGVHFPSTEKYSNVGWLSVVYSKRSTTLMAAAGRTDDFQYNMWSKECSPVPKSSILIVPPPWCPDYVALSQFHVISLFIYYFCPNRPVKISSGLQIKCNHMLILGISKKTDRCVVHIPTRNIYSRLFAALLCKYVTGDQPTENYHLNPLALRSFIVSFSSLFICPAHNFTIWVHAHCPHCFFVSSRQLFQWKIKSSLFQPNLQPIEVTATTFYYPAIL